MLTLRSDQRIVAAYLVLGAVLLGWSLRIEPGSGWFYPAALLLAITWTAGGLQVSRHQVLAGRRDVVPPLAVAAILVAVFAAGAFVLNQISLFDPLLDQARGVLDHADRPGTGGLPVLLLVTAITGVGEELFFRGAVYDAFDAHPIAISTAVYTVVTLATGNVMLTFAAALLGFVTAVQRRATGGLIAPIVTHVAWSMAMIFALPAVL